jgi:hypothetical protein
MRDLPMPGSPESRTTRPSPPDRVLCAVGTGPGAGSAWPARRGGSPTAGPTACRAAAAGAPCSPSGKRILHFSRPSEEK